jgi:hypothetical protein
MHNLCGRNVIGWLTLLGLVVPVPAWGEVRQINATITAQVQEYVGGVEGSFDSAFEDFGTTSMTLPIQVAAGLLPPEETSTNGFIAQAFADFRDPAAATSRNPGEFGLETDAYAQGPDIHFAGEAVAAETRRVVFSGDELSLLAGEDQQRVQSSVFVSGAAVIWSQDPGRDLTGLSVSLRISVEQRLPDAAPLVVFQASLTVQGAPDAVVTLDSPDGIVATLGGPELISAVGGFTEPQLLQELADLGRLHLLLIPRQELTYFYTVPRDVEFDLTATVESRAVNLPGGTGVGAVFGRTFETLTEVIGQSTAAASKGAALQAAVNAAMLDAPASRREPGDAPVAASPAVLCGAMGAGTLGMTFGLLLAALSVRRLD